MLPKTIENRIKYKEGLFGGLMPYDEVIETSIASLKAYWPKSGPVVITYSGGKDSSAVLSFVVWAIQNGHVPEPEKLIVLYADTLIELPPLSITARKVLKSVAALGYDTQIVVPEVDKRLYVQMVGRGLPYPTNRRRWCTRGMKAEPMAAALSGYDDALKLTGVRKGESSIRDDVISTSCSTGDGECGQGWFQQAKNSLAPLLHWRVCNVWKWLYDERNPLPITREIQSVYQIEDIDVGTGAGEIRTGCMKCQVVTEDRSFKFLVMRPEWAWLKPLHQLDQLHEWLSQPAQRLRRVKPTKRADGSYRARHGAPIGPIHLQARKEALQRLLDIEAECLALAPDEYKDWHLLQPEDVTRIREHHAMGTYPGDWSGDEPHGDEPYYKVFVEDGHIIARQYLLPTFELI